MRILGVDPGATSGMSLLVDGEVIAEVEVDSLLRLWDHLYITRPEVIVVESFLGHKFMQPANLELPIKAIAVCELFASLHKIHLEHSNPSRLQNKKKPRGLSPHIWSARTHALAYIKRQ